MGRYMFKRPASEEKANSTQEDMAVDKKADLGLQFINQHGGGIEITEEEDRRVRQKLDLFLMPIVRPEPWNFKPIHSSDTRY
jgi:hypothetical protein